MTESRKVSWQEQHKLDFFIHVPTGRTWLRYNGRILYEAIDDNLTSLELASMLRKRMKLTVLETAEAISAARQHPIKITHPQFVRPAEGKVSGATA